MIINIILFIIFMSMAISTYLLSPDFKHYKKGYNILKTNTFYKDVWGAYSNYDNTFICFENDRGFEISKGVYLTNFSITYMSPYSLYWLIRYQRYMKKYIKNEI